MVSSAPELPAGVLAENFSSFRHSDGQEKYPAGSLVTCTVAATLHHELAHGDPRLHMTNVVCATGEVGYQTPPNRVWAHKTVLESPLWDIIFDNDGPCYLTTEGSHTAKIVLHQIKIRSLCVIKLDEILEEYCELSPFSFSFTGQPHYGLFLVYGDAEFKPRILAMFASHPQLFYSEIAFDVQGARMIFINITLFMAAVRFGADASELKRVVPGIAPFFAENAGPTFSTVYPI